VNCQAIREEALRDPGTPLHRIADRLRPYLRVLAEQFQPEKVMVFGSYAHGTPSENSDVDLLVVMPIRQSRLKDKVAIRAAWWPLLRQGPPLSFDLMLAAPEESADLARDANSFHSEILRKGVRVL